MRLCDDERARVPFALVGIVLLLSSVAITASIQPPRQPTDPTVDRVMRRATAGTSTELRTAIVTASSAAAREPVLTRSQTAAGNVLGTDHTFRDWLRIRIYLRARKRLASHRFHRHGVTATASLPPTPNASALRAAKERVHVDTLDGNATELQVRIENVTITARRHNRTVGRKQISPTLTVRTPVLALHDKVTEFETRLDRGLDKPGLAQRLTGRLWAVTWARGYAQYESGGSAITNVLANRHVGLMTNGAILRMQRAVFNRSDGAGRRALHEAMMTVGFQDLVAESSVDQQWIDTIFPPTPPGQSVPQRIDRYSRSSSAQRPDEPMVVGVNGTADRAFADMVTGSNLTDVLQSVYDANVKVVADVHGGGLSASCRGTRPSGGGYLYDTSSSVRIKHSESFTPGTPPTGGSDWHRIDSAGRRLKLKLRRTCYWWTRDGTKTTNVNETNRFRVELSLVGQHGASWYAPDRPIESYERDGQFSGLDLTDLHERAKRKAVTNNGGWKQLAKRAVTGDLHARRVVEAELPDGLRQQALQDIVAIRDDIRNVSVTVDRGKASTYQSNPAKKLRWKLYTHQASLIDTPEQYQTVGQKARVAARRAYFWKTKHLLKHRQKRRTLRGNNLETILERASGVSDILSKALEHKHGIQQERTPAGDGLTVTAVDGSPPYLTTMPVGHEYVESLPEGTTITPLAARNWNVFTVPHGDVTDTLLSYLHLGKTVRFRVAARTLAGLDAAERVIDDGALQKNLSAQRSTLRGAVDGKLTTIERAYLRKALKHANVGGSRADRMAIIEDGLSKWDSTSARALAITNGSAAASITDAAVDGNETKRAFVRANLQLQLHRASRADNTKIKQAKVDKGSALLRQQIAPKLDDRLEGAMRDGLNRTADRIEQRLGATINRVPAGLAVLPTGTPWWVTTNVWYVEVKGAYDRFAVRARTGSARSPGESVTYVRDGSVVRLDYDDDGTAEQFGRAERVSFTARTAVAIVVPPGPQGVGDKDGNMDERSDGWSTWGSVVTRNGGDTTDRPVPERWPTRDGE